MKDRDMFYQSGRIALHRPIVIDYLVTIYDFEFAKNYRFKGERHNFWELVYVDKGEVTVTADDRVHRLTSGMIIFHKPNEFHSFYASGGSAPNIIVITFFCGSERMRAFEGRILPLDGKERDLLSVVVKEGRRAFAYPFTFPLVRKSDAPAGSEQRLALHLELLLLKLLERLEGGRPAKPDIPSLPKDRKRRNVAEAIVHYMERHLEQPLTLKRISDDLHLAPTSLKDSFRRETGQPLMKYFMRMKIDRAKSLIREEDLTMSEIADRLGFAGLPHFSRTFKKETGLRPSEYARSVKARAEAT